ncbi:hypothetical protein [Pseudofrankia asymbiotica]|uniref:hypothetical protein n=1 Tax=Pseudofrankia asymbiotica TaxID=1834516 RepID=UPI000BBA04CA|nr:hypothetical protein [Pseudofrankia asymbiotica]
MAVSVGNAAAGARAVPATAHQSVGTDRVALVLGAVAAVGAAAGRGARFRGIAWRLAHGAVAAACAVAAFR